MGGILLAIRCLDEGVDIPQISHAVIVASSQNPRQFIQRRGRVLRVAESKNKAVIYDCLVVPSPTSGESNKFNGLISSELGRAIEFSNMAVNSAYADSILRDALINLGEEPEDYYSYLEELDDE